MKYSLLISMCIFIFSHFALSQKQKNANPVYIDKEGVMRWTKTSKKATFFGTNYTVPFAYGYRSHKALGVDIEKAIDADVYHMARLGLNAFRVHVWDVEITDSLGNLLENEHLRLFDYLVKKLKERNIKILITPIAFWGNGYPEPDIKTNGFSYVYGKGGSVVKEEAIKAQENYLQQFFRHVNPYTKLTYKEDPDVIAVEVNNEPHHSGPKERTTEYVNRMAVAVKSTGWTKPIFYNISESPTYADAIVKANVNGYSFQWYPTGLVAGHELKGNFLPHVGQYRIPFNDTIPQFRNGAKMVYEFDAGDVMQPVMYPAIARSYRTAGFQWATQFAYDPMATAYANTEYQTHYLNLAYTPSKAISLLIASKVFHRLPRLKSYGAYPADTLFDVFRVSYKEQLSEMNSEDEFYYTGSTNTQPKNFGKLKHIAGVGSSQVVKYDGTGAYFLDKLSDGVWKLEVMPDAITIRDPFEKASPKKEVTRIQWQANKMQLNLLLPKGHLVINGINKGNDYQTIATIGKDFFIAPGVYSISISDPNAANRDLLIPLPEFYAPPSSSGEPFVVHQPLSEVTADKSFSISAKIIGIDTADGVSIELRNSANKWKTISLQHLTSYDFKANVPADIVTPGIINYRIIIQKKNKEFFIFPGALKGDAYAWDEYRNESWQTFITSAGTPITLFNATTDRNLVVLYNPDWRNNTVEYITGDKPSQLVLKTTMNKPQQIMGWQYFFKDKITGRADDLPSFSKLVIRARSAEEAQAKISLITSDAQAFATNITLGKSFKEFEIPLKNLVKDSMLLLPRPYPGFLPLWFTTVSTKPFIITDAEKLEVRFSAGAESVSIEVESVYLKK